MDPTMDNTKHILNYLMPIIDQVNPEVHDFMQRYVASSQAASGEVPSQSGAVFPAVLGFTGWDLSRASRFLQVDLRSQHWSKAFCALVLSSPRAPLAFETIPLLCWACPRCGILAQAPPL